MAFPVSCRSFSNVVSGVQGKGQEKERGKKHIIMKHLSQ